MHRRGCAGGLKHGTITAGVSFLGQTCANLVHEALTERDALRVSLLPYVGNPADSWIMGYELMVFINNVRRHAITPCALDVAHVHIGGRTRSNQAL